METKPTDLNLAVLASVFATASMIDNTTFSAADLAHLRPCLKAGLVEVRGGARGVLVLTVAGEDAISAFRVRRAIAKMRECRAEYERKNERGRARGYSAGLFDDEIAACDAQIRHLEATGGLTRDARGLPAL